MAPHFTAKARIMDYAKETYPEMICVFPSVCAFYTNWIERTPPKYARHQKPPPNERHVCSTTR